MSSPQVSVILVNYNGRRNLGKLLKSCLASAFETDYPSFEVLFVDNASTDDSVEFVKKEFGQNPKLRIIQNERNLGFAEGNNVGIKTAKGDYIALLNCDAKADPQWLKELVKALQSPEIGAAQSKLLLMDDPSLMDCAGGFVDYYGYHHFEVGYKRRSEEYNRVYEVFYAKGAGMIVKKDVVKSAGAFDSKMFMYFEETDLCWRIRLNGYKIVFVPTSIVYHAAGSVASVLQENNRLYFSTRNHLLTVLKNYDDSNLSKAVAVSLIWEVRNLGKFVLKRKPQFISAVVRGLLWNLLNLKYVWTERQRTQMHVRKVADESIKKVMLKPSRFPLYLVHPWS